MATLSHTVDFFQTAKERFDHLDAAEKTKIVAGLSSLAAFIALTLRSIRHHQAS